MTNLENYLDDGANWQAQCVLAILRSRYESILDESWNKEQGRYEACIRVGRYESDREQGYAFALNTMGIQRNYVVYEHRNSDEICIVVWDGLTLNTPTPSQVPMKDKWDVTKTFRYGEVMECAEWIEKDMMQVLPAQLEQMRKFKEENEMK